MLHVYATNDNQRRKLTNIRRSMHKAFIQRNKILIEAGKGVDGIIKTLLIATLHRLDKTIARLRVDESIALSHTFYQKGNLVDEAYPVRKARIRA